MHQRSVKEAGRMPSGVTNPKGRLWTESRVKRNAVKRECLGGNDRLRLPQLAEKLGGGTSDGG